MKLRYTPRALAELDEVLAYSAERSPQGARRVQLRIQAVTALLLQHPHSGQRTSNPRLRRIVATPYPYLIFYEIAGDESSFMRYATARATRARCWARASYPPRRCRIISPAAIAQAIATLSERMPSRIGMTSRASAVPITSSGTPADSRPNSSTCGVR